MNYLLVPLPFVRLLLDKEFVEEDAERPEIYSSLDGENIVKGFGRHVLVRA